MNKTLVISEKPSVAGDIARALGNAQRRGDYFENDNFIITSAIGHLVEIYNPNEETADYKSVRKTGPAKSSDAKAAPKAGKWSLDSLPVIPSEFALRPTKNTVDRVKLIARLAKRSEVTEVINACDAGREGELIFHNLAKYINLTKPVRRLWLQSMTPQAIRDGFAQLRDEKELLQLREAAIARSDADWLVGINATRALTALNSKDGGFILTTAGRVQTPTLAMLVSRERERNAHVPKPYWLLDITCKATSGVYTARWVRSLGQDKDEAAADNTEGRGRIWDEQQAKQITDMVTSDDPLFGTATDVSKKRTLQPPALFDLNSLQREANRRHSLSARRTMQAAQALYERYKLLTYPRTESRHLPPDYVSVVSATLKKLGQASSDQAGDNLQMSDIAKLSKVAVEGVRTVGKKVFDATKITDHFAIIPTGELPRPTLPELEQKIYNLVCRRFVARFMPPAVQLHTTRTTTVDNEQFESKGSVTLEPGWLAATSPDKGSNELPPLAGESEQVTISEPDLQDKVTNPPARYDDAKLLGAMQGAYKAVSEEDLASALQQGGGLGTPATRANIIEELIRHDYIVRSDKELIPTQRAFSLIDLLDGMHISMLTKPQLTGQWESRLKSIEQGTETSAEFLSGIYDLSRQIASVAKQYNPDTTEGEYATLTASCPRCREETMRESYRKYMCTNEQCKFFIWKIIASRPISPEEAEILLSTGSLGPLDDFKSRRGLPFTAKVLLEESGKVDFEFPADQDLNVDFETLEIIGACPVCQADVGAAGGSFFCRNLSSKKCDFRLGRTILKRELANDECAYLLKERKSDLLKGFISRRGRPFSAYLVIDNKGKLSFEFDKPAAKKKPAKRSAKKSAKPAAKKAALKSAVIPD